MLSLSLCLALLDSDVDNDAYTEFFNKYHRLVIHKAKQIVKNQESAEDIAQEVFLYAAEHFTERFYGREHSHIMHYLICCTGSRAIDFLRKQKSEYLDFENAELEGFFIEDTAQIVFRKGTSMCVFEIIKSLPEIYCAALSLKLDGESYAEIAEMLNISPQNAYKRVQRAYAMVRERMVTEDAE